MKPSQRITQLTIGHDPANLCNAIMRYLDEQHELERRRIYFNAALKLVQPMLIGGGSDTQVNGYLEKAGLALRVYEGSSFAGTVAEIMAAGEQAGLL